MELYRSKTHLFPISQETYKHLGGIAYQELSIETQLELCERRCFRDALCPNFEALLTFTVNWYNASSSI